MDDILTIVKVAQSLWIACIVIMLFWKFRIGVAGYMAYMFLVPYMKIDFGGLTLQWNIINILLLFAFFVHRQRDYDEQPPLDWRPLLPFALYFGISLLIMPFQDGLPFADAINSWRTQVLKYLILPFVLWNDICANYDSLKLYRNVTIGCITIAALYGLCLTLSPGINPYMIILSVANGEEFNYAFAAGNSGLNENSTLSEGRLFGRISSVFSHPMTFGLFLGFALFYLYRNKDNLNRWLVFGLTLFILTDIVVCGVRSVIIATFFAIWVLLMQSRSYKLLLATIVGGIILYAFIAFSPALGTYIGSIFAQNDSSFRGSTLAMRLAQWDGCLHEIQHTFIEGKGFGWTNYFLSQYESHPTMLNFESLIFVILCNSGIIGVVIWTLMGIIIVRYNNWSDRIVAALLNSLFAFYIVYAIITGEYGYMQYFILFYILMLGEDLYRVDDEDTEEEEEEFEESAAPEASSLYNYS